MVRRLTDRPTWLLMFAVFMALAVAAPALAQQSGTVKGIVKSDSGQPVEGARVIIDRTDGAGTSHFEAKTNKKGEYLQVGLPSGGYKVMAEKDKLGSAPMTFSVRAYQTVPIDLVLNMAAAAAAAKAGELKQIFEDGVALSNSGKHAEAIEKFTIAAQISPACSDCYDNIGTIYTQDKEYDKAEGAFKKAIEINANDASAYNGLANVYNAQRKFDDAVAAGKKASELSGALGAAGGASGNADSLYNQGVALFNSGKPAEAKPLFQQAVQLKADHADAHFMLAQTLVGEANFKDAVAEYEMYLKLAPSGSHAKEASENVTTLKPMVK